MRHNSDLRDSYGYIKKEVLSEQIIIRQCSRKFGRSLADSTLKHCTFDHHTPAEDLLDGSSLNSRHFFLTLGKLSVKF